MSQIRFYNDLSTYQLSHLFLLESHQLLGLLRMATASVPCYPIASYFLGLILWWIADNHLFSLQQVFMYLD